MHSNVAIEKISKEMLDRGLLPRIQTEGQDKLIRFYFGLIYAVGFDEGRKQYSHRKQVAKYTMEGKFVRIYPSITEAANAVRRNKTAVMKSAQGKTEHCGGFKWKFIEDVTLENSR